MPVNLHSLLFDRADAEGLNTYAVLDGASVPDLLDRLDQFEPEYECLYRGELKPDLAAVAPYLVDVVHESEFAGWLLSNGWGAHWGIFLKSTADLPELRHHFRKLLIVHDESGKPMYFRFYDPRVMRIFLPTCNPAELTEIFGPIQEFLFEDETKAVCLNARFSGGHLKVKNLEISLLESQSL